VFRVLMIRTTFLAFAAAALVAAPAASAHPGTRGFQRTYPHASRLCAKVANGHTPKRLAASTTQVAGACAQLKSSFTAAQNTYTTTVAPLKQQARDTVKAARATIRQARANHDRASARATRHDARATLRALRKQVREAARAYHVSVDAARKTFWSTVRALRGGTSVTPDKRVGAAPSASLPSL
jgi:hypothetical protein